MTMTRTHRIALLPGDGVGPEVTLGARRVMEAVTANVDLELSFEEYPVGWAAVLETGSPLPEATLAGCHAADAVFLGAVGDPAADGVEPARRPEAGLLALRAALGLFTNLRPLKIIPALAEHSPLRRDRVEGVDLMIVRELAGGLYYGEPRELTGIGDGRSARNTLSYDASEVTRVAEVAFRLAAGRRGRLVSIDKANVLETSRLWREVVDEVALRHPAVAHEHMLVDRAAMELVLRPGQFDVILTENLFGDILSDEAAGVAGSLGLLPSASLGTGTPLFEPVHGSAPDLAGKGLANPTAAILSAAMLLEHALARPDAARAIEDAVEQTFAAGVRTGDLVGDTHAAVGTEAFTDAVVGRLVGSFSSA
jgi:3-isopropylmalate dehydrogenase